MWEWIWIGWKKKFVVCGNSIAEIEERYKKRYAYSYFFSIFFYRNSLVCHVLILWQKKKKVEWNCGNGIFEIGGKKIYSSWREGAKIAYFGANWKFSLCTHILRIFFFKIWGDAPHPRPRLGSSLHVLLLRFSHVFFFFFHEMKVYF